MAPIVTLTTDFGTRDPWVGIMKGVILGLCPDARLVDLTHEVSPQDVREGQLALAAAVPFFPSGTVHLAVVDPGVGSARRALAVESGGHYFVGPDNGLFTFALEGAAWSAVSLAAADLRLPRPSRTFHGRDVFAPAAAHLARGMGLARFGPAVADPVRLPLPLARHEDAAVAGEVIAVDRFGNLITSITTSDLETLGGPLEVAVAGRDLGPPVEAYVDGPAGTAAAVVGSLGRLEVFVRGGSAARALRARPGTPVRARRAPAGVRTRPTTRRSARSASTPAGKTRGPASPPC